MRIEAVSMQNGFAYANGKIRKDPSLNAQQLEETKEKMDEQVAKTQQDDVSGKHDVEKREYVRMQMDGLDNRTVSLLQQGYESALNFKKDSEVGGAFVDKYVKSDTSVAANTAGIYNFEKEEDEKSKTVFGRSETSRSRIASSESETKHLDEAEEEDKPTAISGKDEPKASAEGEEKPEKASGNPSDDKSDRQTTVNTDRVEAEIRKLNQEKQRIQQALGRATGDDAERERLQKRFEMIEAELSMKDTDTYRRQNAEYS